MNSLIVYGDRRVQTCEHFSRSSDLSKTLSRTIVPPLCKPSDISEQTIDCYLMKGRISKIRDFLVSLLSWTTFPALYFCRNVVSRRPMGEQNSRGVERPNIESAFSFASEKAYLTYALSTSNSEKIFLLSSRSFRWDTSVSYDLTFDWRCFYSGFPCVLRLKWGAKPVVTRSVPRAQHTFVETLIILWFFPQKQWTARTF